MNPFGIDHEISKSQFKSPEAKKHEKKTYGNLAVGITGIAAGTAGATRYQDKVLDASSSSFAGRMAGNRAEAVKQTVENSARRGRLHPSVAVDRGKEWGRSLEESKQHYRNAGKIMDSAKKTKRAAIATGAVGAAAYGNAINHAIKADKSEKSYRAKKAAATRKANTIKKSAFGIEH